MKKTLRSRIAAVAVVAMGVSLLSQAPALATDSEVASGTVTAVNLTAATANTGVVSTTQRIYFGHTTVAQTAPGGGNYLLASYKAAMTSYPAGGFTLPTGSTTDGLRVTDYDSSNPVTASGNTVVLKWGNNKAVTPETKSSDGTQGLGSFTFVPSVVGTYGITVWNDRDGDDNIDYSEAQQSITITVTTASAASSDFGTTADTGVAQVTATTVVAGRPSGRVGVPVGFVPRVSIKNPTATANQSTKYAQVRYTLTTPSGSAGTIVTAAGGTTAVSSEYIQGGSSIAQDTTAFAYGTQRYFTPTSAGTYTVTIWHDANRDTLQGAYEAIGQATFTIAADAQPSITFSGWGDANEANTNSLGRLVRVSLKNGTAAAGLALNEVLEVSGPAGTVFNNVSTFGSGALSMGSASGQVSGTTLTLTASNFNGLGYAYFNITNTTDNSATTVSSMTYSVTGTIIGGTANGATGSFTLTTYDDASATAYYAVATATGSLTNVNADAGVSGVSATTSSATKTWTVKTGVATTVAASIVVGADKKTIRATVVDTQGLITGVVGASYSLLGRTTTGTTSTSAVSFSVAIPATTTALTAAAGNLAVLTVYPGTTRTINIQNAAAAVTSCYINPAQDSSTFSLRAASGSTNTFSGLVTDQFGNAMSNVAVDASVSGRNSTAVFATKLSNADGIFSFSLADTYVGSVFFTDTFTISPTGIAVGSECVVTVNYAAYLPVASITMTTPDSATATATGIAGTVTTDIDASKGGATGSLATVSVVLKDANGATLPAGIPVTFTISGNDSSAVLSTKVVGYTDSVGATSTQVYGWKNGNATVTATAGGISKSGVVYFKQAECTPGAACAEARKVTATVSGQTVTAVVTDRFGNPIKGVTLYASRVGTGNFAGSSSAQGNTDADGRVDFVVSGGAATVTVAFSSTTFGQTYATKGYVDAGITAITAYVAGDSATAPVGVGASFDDAGVNSVTVSVAAAPVDTTALDAAKAAAEAAKAEAAKATAAAEAAKAAAAADAAKAQAAIAALNTTITSIQTAISTLVASVTATLTAMSAQIAKIMKKFNIK